MRASICVERASVSYRLAWLSESRKGIYYGHLGSDMDHHVSYHSDGVRHFKSGKSRYLEFVDVPPAQSRGFRQLLNGNVPLSSEWLNASTEYRPSRPQETAISLPEERLVGCDSILIDYWLVDRPSEEEFRAVVSASVRPHLSLVELRTLALDNYPAHLVGIALCAGKTRS